MEDGIARETGRPILIPKYGMGREIHAAFAEQFSFCRQTAKIMLKFML